MGKINIVVLNVDQNFREIEALSSESTTIIINQAVGDRLEPYAEMHLPPAPDVVNQLLEIIDFLGHAFRKRGGLS